MVSLVVLLKSVARVMSKKVKSRREEFNELLRDGSMQQLQNKIGDLENTPKFLRTRSWKRPINKIKKTIKQRKSAQEAVGAKGGGMIGKNKIIKGYKKGG